MGRRVEGNDYPPPCLDIFKISKGKRVLSPSSCLDIFKIRMEKKVNDLNRQIYQFSQHSLF